MGFGAAASSAIPAFPSFQLGLCSYSGCHTRECVGIGYVWTRDVVRGIVGHRRIGAKQFLNLGDGHSFHHVRNRVNERRRLRKAIGDMIRCGGLSQRGIQFRDDGIPELILLD